MSIRHRYFLLIGLRWLATGFIVPVSTLFLYSRGLSVTQIGTAVAAQGLMTLLLEIPSGAMGDAIGRRPVQVIGAVAAIAGYAVMVSAHSVLVFFAAYAIIGVFRAMDSGALESWYVDSEINRGAATEVPSGVARGGAITSIGIAVGAALSAGLVRFSPWDDELTMMLPYFAAISLMAVHGVLAYLLMGREPRTESAQAQTWKGALGDGIKTATGPVLRWFFISMVLFGAGVIALENYTPLRLEEFSGDLTGSAVSFGMVSALAWGVSSLGSMIVSRLLERRSPQRMTIWLGLFEGLALCVMALARSPLLLIGGFWAAYSVHSGYGASFNAVVHAKVENRFRGTALSIMSMAFMSSASFAGIWLGVITDASSLAVGQAVGGSAILASALAVAWGVRRRHDKSVVAPADSEGVGSTVAAVSSDAVLDAN